MSTIDEDIPILSEWFWDIVDRAQRDPEKLRQILMQATKEEIPRFQVEFDSAAIALTDSPFTDYIDREVTEDGLKDLTDWVVSHGKSYYLALWENPARMPSGLEDYPADEDLSWVAGKVYRDRFGEIMDTWSLDSTTRL